MKTKNELHALEVEKRCINFGTFKILKKFKKNCKIEFFSVICIEIQRRGTRIQELDDGGTGEGLTNKKSKNQNIWR